ncbi:MAG: lipid A export permease/ATP-binding protein MsbA [Gammaproteobacteria bacterium]|nr:lipid A export permease/ATP-binding protein MsbA [Gammaproteobacteria bacterium]
MARKITFKSDVQLYRRLLGFIRPYFIWIVIAILFNGIYSAVDSGFIYGLKPILNHGFIDRDPRVIFWLPILIPFAFLLRGGANVVAGYAMSYAARSVVMRFRQRIFDHLLALPATFYDNHSTGELLSIILYNVDQLSSVSADVLTTVAQSGFMMLFLLGVMFSISWKLSLLTLVVAPITAYAMRYSNKRARRLSQGLQVLMAEVTTTAEEVTEGYKVVRAFGGQEYEKEKFYKLTRKTRRRDLHTVITRSLSTSMVQFLCSIAFAVIAYIVLAHHTSLSAGGFISLIAAMLAILKPLKNMTKVTTRIQRGLAAAQSVFDLLDQKLERDQGEVVVERVKGAVSYRQVNFRYPNSDRQVLSEVNFDLQAGKSVALVGRSGGGKSTFVSLLPHFYDHYDGTILIDDVDIREYKLANLRQQFAFVSQDIVLFNDSIAHNIAYGQFDAVNEEKIIAAAKAAHAWEFIVDMPQGLQTIIGENGVLLSGGQRQRIAIARAILKDSPILILDEATAALDSEAERCIQQALEELMKQRTTLVIAHRLSTIENVDTILVIEQGRIIESGSHTELLARNQHYARLYRMQFRDRSVP